MLDRMPSRERAVERSLRIARDDLARVSRELRGARSMAGLSLVDVGRAASLSPSQLSRIERGLAPSTPLGALTRIGAVVGLDLRLRAYPAGDPVRDLAQIRLIGRLRDRLPPNLGFRTEVPLPIVSDLRAWDGWIDGLDGAGPGEEGLPVEAETRIADVQAQTRRLTLKMRDGGVASVILVVAETRANRATIDGAGPVVAELFPISPRRALQALAAGRHPGGSALVFL
jgi:transcriptional regulator with XRE-family HTH domain